ncbi:alpha/beta hydrolase [Streptomyces sp. A7024]|uniref:Alpha/beta hydrolase n=1 Tax=Streptomyces coryli TaxID=1128680 RepID=A0A6G4U1U8_9ACTN|nr:alpha/beta hydrolase [Streptomyces coryli]
MLMTAAWFYQRHLIYFPERGTPPLPDVPGLREVHYRTSDGLRLTGWFLAAEGGEPYATVVVANGNGGNRAGRVGLAEGLAERGYSVLLTDYRGYGGNPGSPSESGLTADLRAAVAYAAGRPDTDPRRLVYFGESLGTAVAAAVAADRPPAALVLRSPFPELADIAQDHYWYVPTRLLLRDRFRTSQHLSAYDGPLQVIAGTRDEIVRPALTRDVADEHATTYTEIDSAHHNDPALFDSPELLTAVDRFLRSAIPR